MSLEQTKEKEEKVTNLTDPPNSEERQQLNVKDQPGHTHVSESKTNESEHSASSSNEVKSPSTHDQSLETKQEPSKSSKKVSKSHHRKKRRKSLASIEDIHQCQRQVQRRESFQKYKSHSLEKLEKFFGIERDDIFDASKHKQWAPQPPHVKEVKIRRFFGEEIPLDKTEDEEREVFFTIADRNRRLQRFFGEKFDVDEVTYDEKLNSTAPEPTLERHPSRQIQPSHVDTVKLNKFFGRFTNIQKKEVSQTQTKESHLEGPLTFPNRLTNTSTVTTEINDNQSSKECPFPLLSQVPLTGDEEEKHRRELRKRQKLRKMLGEYIEDVNTNTPQFAPQPHHVKSFKLTKRFGEIPVVDRVMCASTDDFVPIDLDHFDLGEERHIRSKRKVKKVLGSENDISLQLKPKEEKNKNEKNQ